MIGPGKERDIMRDLYYIEGYINHQYNIDPDGIDRRELVDNVNNVEYKFHIKEEDTIETPIRGIIGIQNKDNNNIIKRGMNRYEKEDDPNKIDALEYERMIEFLVALDTGTSKSTHKHGEEKNRYCLKSWRIKPVFFNTPGGLVRSDRMGKYIIPALDNLEYRAYIIEGGMDLISPFMIQKEGRRGNRNWVMICDNKYPRMKNLIDGRIVPLKIINNIPYLNLVKRYQENNEILANQRLKKNAKKLKRDKYVWRGKIENLEFFNKRKTSEIEIKALVTYILEEIKKENINEIIGVQEIEKMNLDAPETDEYNPYHKKDIKDCTCKAKNHLPGDASRCLACLLGKFKRMKTRRNYRNAFNQPQLDYLKRNFLTLLDKTIGKYKEEVEQEKKNRKFGENLSMDVTFSSESSSRGEVDSYTIKDRATQWIEAYPIKTWPKGSLSVEVMRKFLCGNSEKVNTIRTDNGAEFVATNFTNYIEKELKAVHLKGLPYTPESEMDHEALHAVMNANIRSMIIQAGLPVDLLAYAMTAYFWNRNRFYKNPRLEGITAYEKRFGKPYEKVEEYTWGQGCAYIVNKHMPFYHKYGSRAREGIIIGRDSGGWVIIDVQTAVEEKGKLYVTKSNHVKLEQDDFPGVRYNFAGKYSTEKWTLMHRDKLIKCDKCDKIILKNRPTCRQCKDKKAKQAHSMDPIGCRKATCECPHNQIYEDKDDSDSETEDT